MIYMTQEWLAKNFHNHINLNIGPPSSPDLNSHESTGISLKRRPTNGTIPRTCWKIQLQTKTICSEHVISWKSASILSLKLKVVLLKNFFLIWTHDQSFWKYSFFPVECFFFFFITCFQSLGTLCITHPILVGGESVDCICIWLRKVLTFIVAHWLSHYFPT